MACLRPFVVLLVLLVLEGCTSMRKSGAHAGTPFRELSMLAVASWIWLLPALYVWLVKGFDRNEVSSVHATGYSSTGEPVHTTAYVPTGRTVSKDIKGAKFWSAVWLTNYPLVYFGIFSDILPKWIFDPDNFLWYLGGFLVFIAIVSWLVYLVFRSTSRWSRIVKNIWLVVIVAGVINLGGWAVYVCFIQDGAVVF